MRNIFDSRSQKGLRSDPEILFVGSGQGAMAEAPNLEGSIAALMLRVARVEDRLREMDLPFVEDRLENMETVVAALKRALDEFYERFETLQRLTRRLEADMRSLERERQTMFMLADRISHVETIPRQETQGALEHHQIALEDISRRVTSLEAVIVGPAD